MSYDRKEYAALGPISCPRNLHDSQLSPQTGEAIAIGGYVISNRSNANADVGLFELLPTAMWSAGTLTAASTPDYLDASANAKSTTANAFVNIFTATNASGFLIGCKEKFSAFSCAVGDATATTGANILVQYYNGSAYSNCSVIQAPDFTSGSGALTQSIFTAGNDWTIGSNAAVGGPANNWCIRVVSVDATGGSNCSVSDVRVYQMIDFFPQMQTNNQLIDELQGSERKLHTGGSVAAYFGGTANTANYVQLEYRALSRQV